MNADVLQPPTHRQPLQLSLDLAPPRPTRRRYRPRGSAFPILALREIASYGLLTRRQVIARLWTERGSHPSHGWRVLRRLVRRGWIDVRQLDPERGCASVDVLALTPAGSAAAGLEHPPGGSWPRTQTLLEHRLQIAETLMIRRVEGWALVAEGESEDAVRRWALRPFRERMGTDTDRVVANRIRRLALSPLPYRILRHTETGDVRLVVTVRKGRSVLGTLRQVPDMRLCGQIGIELVGADTVRCAGARTTLRRWAKATKHDIAIFEVPNFRLAPHPESGAGRPYGGSVEGAPRSQRTRISTKFVATPETGVL